MSTATPLRVRDLMAQDPYTLGPGDNLADVYDLMDTKHVRHVPIVDDDGDLLGLISHRDLVRTAVADSPELPVGAQRQILKSVSVSELMTGGVESVDPRTDLRDAGLMMLEHKFGCLPVTEGEKLVGIITESDFVRHVVEAL